MPQPNNSLKLAKALRFQIGVDGNLYASISNSQGSFFVSPEVLSFLCAIGNEKNKKLPNSKEWKQLLQELIGAGLVIDTTQNKKANQPEDGFADSWIQWAMISDRIRCVAYENAIRKNINANSNVLDVGAGCGFLTSVALDSGAKKVTAIEETQSSRFISPILKKLNQKFQNKLILENKNSFDVEINKDITLVVSELFGNDPFSEGVISTLKEIASRFGSKQPQYIPEKLTCYFEIVEILEHPTLHRLSAFQNKTDKKPQDFFQKFLSAAKESLDLKNISFPLAVDKKNMKRISKSAVIGTTDLNPPTKNVKNDFCKKIKIHIEQENQNTITGLLWFRVHLTKDITISSHPLEKDACEHWSPIAIAISQTVGKNKDIEIETALDEFENFLYVTLYSDKKRIGGR
jgi:16S rRNA G966 N2-methylase RsmD